jgi:divalent metal cation (Fe/Co/Zn/Cd) transporter
MMPICRSGRTTFEPIIEGTRASLVEIDERERRALSMAEADRAARWFSTYKARVARHIHSATLAADAKHSWLDMLSSIGALVGLGGVALGYRWADPVAGAVVTLFICHVGFEVTEQVLHHLLDGVEPEDMAAARAAVLGVAGVRAADVRGRWMGRSLIVEIEGVLDCNTPLAAALDLGVAVDAAVRAAIPHVRSVRWLPRP